MLSQGSKNPGENSQRFFLFRQQRQKEIIIFGSDSSDLYIGHAQSGLQNPQRKVSKLLPLQTTCQKEILLRNLVANNRESPLLQSSL
jgi:hypothetical protein